jgi:hypothetical protein
MPLLERDPVLASLRQYAHEAGQDGGRLVLIAGEAGVGKSVLVDPQRQSYDVGVYSAARRSQP